MIRTLDGEPLGHNNTTCSSCSFRLFLLLSLSPGQVSSNGTSTAKRQRPVILWGCQLINRSYTSAFVLQLQPSPWFSLNVCVVLGWPYCAPPSCGMRALKEDKLTPFA